MGPAWALCPRKRSATTIGFGERTAETTDEKTDATSALGRDAKADEGVNAAIVATIKGLEQAGEPSFGIAQV